jgi:hypothetical protein
MKSVMKAWRRGLIAVILLIVIDSARAGAREGELFGYRLGARYPLTSQTRTGMSGFFRYVYAEHPVKPRTISEVTLLTTPKTLQIVAITGLRGFSDRATAWRFFNVFAPMLGAHYGISWRDNRKHNGVEAILSSRYRLSLYVTSGDLGGAIVYVSLTRTSMRDIAAQARAELKNETRKPVARPYLQGF